MIYLLITLFVAIIFCEVMAIIKSESDRKRMLAIKKKELELFYLERPHMSDKYD